MDVSSAMVEVQAVMRRLKDVRPIFHSEADFQHAFAWEMNRLVPEGQFRLECKRAGLGPRERLDIWIRWPTGQFTAVELKYKKRPLQVEIDNEAYDLTSDAAQDLGRYDFLLDVCRIERIVADHPKTEGFAILLTDDSGYWNGPSGKETIDAAFRLHEGRCVSGLLAWDKRAGAGTTKNREAALSLSGNYTCAWSDYSVVANRPGGQLRYLSVYVPAVVAGPAVMAMSSSTRKEAGIEAQAGEA